ncbi:hypothetical protein B0J13DRAFT_160170 [Dactylonectria estremocensis]|uniref:Uncharacterized protein n=1 Tax=Dactylonectria estremocensis TaxID=1079267 RepID=A0A9P9IJP5_9HYPO|nr:hypothetical protein B0J13DRAFT_160170 [Dactylonectria estremocensis]
MSPSGSKTVLRRKRWRLFSLLAFRRSFGFALPEGAPGCSVGVKNKAAASKHHHYRFWGTFSLSGSWVEVKTVSVLHIEEDRDGGGGFGHVVRHWLSLQLHVCGA